MTITEKINEIKNLIEEAEYKKAFKGLKKLFNEIFEDVDIIRDNVEITSHEYYEFNMLMDKAQLLGYKG